MSQNFAQHVTESCNMKQDETKVRQCVPTCRRLSQYVARCARMLQIVDKCRWHCANCCKCHEVLRITASCRGLPWLHSHLLLHCNSMTVRLRRSKHQTLTYNVARFLIAFETLYGSVVSQAWSHNVTNIDDKHVGSIGCWPCFLDFTVTCVAGNHLHNTQQWRPVPACKADQQKGAPEHDLRPNLGRVQRG